MFDYYMTHPDVQEATIGQFLLGTHVKHVFSVSRRGKGGLDRKIK